MANINVEIVKNPGENNTNVLRRFSRKIQELRLMQKVKSKRYAERKTTQRLLKRSALRRIAKVKDREKQKKLGKVIVK